MKHRVLVMLIALCMSISLAGCSQKAEPSTAGSAAEEEKPAVRLFTNSTGRIVEVPFGPYNWMGFPPSVQRYLGMLWFELLYPETADYDLYEEAKTYYDLFYHCELTENQYQELVANSIGKAEKL